MAVVKYTVTVVGGVANISPTIDQVVFVSGDFLEFNPPVDGAGDIFFQVTGANRVLVAAADVDALKLQPPELDPATGNIFIAFTPSGGNPGGGNGFPPG